MKYCNFSIFYEIKSHNTIKILYKLTIHLKKKFKITCCSFFFKSVIINKHCVLFSSAFLRKIIIIFISDKTDVGINYNKKKNAMLKMKNKQIRANSLKIL